MGTWGLGAFDNDDAMDWCYALKYANDLAPIETALNGVLNRGKHNEYLELSDCCESLAAAEVIAAVKGKSAVQLPQEVVVFIKRHTITPSPRIIKLACDAVTAVRDVSELRDLWDETDDAEYWLKGVDDLRERLTAR